MRRFAHRIILAGLAVGLGYGAATVLAPRRPGGPALDFAGKNEASGSTEVEASTVGESQKLGHGDDIALRMLDALERRPNVAAKMRQSLLVEGRRLTGAGEYWQQGVFNQRRSRWQIQTIADGQSVQYRQVLADGRYLWTDRSRGEQRSVTRVDVSRLMRELNVGDVDDRKSASAAAPWIAEPQVLARGGLCQLAADLVRCFTFDEPQFLEVGGKPMAALVGRWRSEQIARQWPQLDAQVAGASWPAHLPHHVLLLAGKDDLFPYIIEYRGGDQAMFAVTAAPLTGTEPLAKYEFYDVSFAAPMPEELFQFQAADTDWQDVTTAAIDRVRREIAPARVEKNAQREDTASRPY